MVLRLSRALHYHSANWPLAAGEGIEPSAFRRRCFRDSLSTLLATRHARVFARGQLREKLLERVQRMVTCGFSHTSA